MLLTCHYTPLILFLSLNNTECSILLKWGIHTNHVNSTCRKSLPTHVAASSSCWSNYCVFSHKRITWSLALWIRMIIQIQQTCKESPIGGFTSLTPENTRMPFFCVTSWSGLLAGNMAQHCLITVHIWKSKRLGENFSFVHVSRKERAVTLFCKTSVVHGTSGDLHHEGSMCLLGQEVFSHTSFLQ